MESARWSNRMKNSSSMIESVYQLPELKRCPVETTFRIIGKKWTVLIIREMFRGTTQFNRFLEGIRELTPKVLTERMKELQRLGIIKRKIVSESPIRVEYILTDLGRQLEPTLLAAASFSMSCLPKTVFRDGKPKSPSYWPTKLIFLLAGYVYDIPFTFKMMKIFNDFSFRYYIRTALYCSSDGILSPCHSSNFFGMFFWDI
jgi:DNA-binding HxlR family transcriptional regulator